MNQISSVLEKVGAGNLTGTTHAPAGATSGIKKIALALVNSSIGEAKFRWNKLAHLAATANIGNTLPFISKIGSLNFYVGKDEKGILRGGNLHWTYMQDPCGNFLTDKQKFKALCGSLAQLPGNVAFAFKASPDMRDGDVVRAAFKKAGFINIPRQTFLYKPEKEDGDPISKIKSDARTKVNSARRELELTSMDIDSFFEFYQDNLDAKGKESHFFLNIDHALIAKGAKFAAPVVQVIAVSKKSTEENQGPHPVEAAIICSSGDDGYLKLMRITYTRDCHKHAIKMLVVEAMKRAQELGATLDVDGATPGGGTVYSRFGVFETVMHDEFTRKTAATLIRKFL